jgi:catechol 2,3-dioxygenase-like lactoylglutathione lyase family enzyme
MALRRMDNVLIVVADLEAAKAFFVELGMGRIMFEVDDVDDVVARLRGRGAELVGEIARYEDAHRLCNLRGPEGIVFGLAERIG